MDTVDRDILNHLQYDFPVSIRPFSDIADKVSISEDEVLSRIGELKKNGVIRQISAIFDSKKVGYRGVLVAFKVPGDRLEKIAEELNGNPGISHNYLRDCEYNLWFTLTVPEDRELEEEVRVIAGEKGITQWLFLPTLRQFKISFRLDMNESAGNANTLSHHSKKVHEQNGQAIVDKDFVRELQKDLPLCPHPYRQSSEALGCTEEKVVEKVKHYIETGIIRRVASVLRPVHAGFPANVLVVWAAEPDKIELLGKIAAGRNNVSHCYERPSSEQWPYSVYAMIHGRSIDECRAVIGEIERESGVTDYRLLPTIKEYKKVRVEYYPVK